MRLSCRYGMEGVLPLDYRPGFMSLLKKALNKSNPALYAELYENMVTKPFTFSIYFGGGLLIDKNEGTLRSNYPEISLNMSSNSAKLITFVYNGLLEIPEYPIYKANLRLKEIRFSDSARIDNDYAMFKTLSPILIKTSRREKDEYILPDHPEFKERLNYYVNLTWREITKVEGKFDVNFIPLPKKINKEVVFHMRVPFTAFRGVFVLQGEPEILQFIYDVGLGIRRNQGFGMLEVVR
jgi:CRISPR-associated endoribonuclease Cas6